MGTSDYLFCTDSRFVDPVNLQRRQNERYQHALNSRLNSIEQMPVLEEILPGVLDGAEPAFIALFAKTANTPSEAINRMIAKMLDGTAHKTFSVTLPMDGRYVVYTGKGIEKYVGSPVLPNSKAHYSITTGETQVGQTGTDPAKGNSYMIFPIYGKNGEVIGNLNVSGVDFGQTEHIRGKATSVVLSDYLKNMDHPYSNQLTALKGLTFLNGRRQEEERTLIADISKLMHNLLYNGTPAAAKKEIAGILELEEPHAYYAEVEARLYNVLRILSKGKKGLKKTHNQDIERLLERLEQVNLRKERDTQIIERFKKKDTGVWKQASKSSSTGD